MKSSLSHSTGAQKGFVLRRGLRGFRLFLQGHLSNGGNFKPADSGPCTVRETWSADREALQVLSESCPLASPQGDSTGHGPFPTPSFRWDPWSLPGMAWSSRDPHLPCPGRALGAWMRHPAGIWQDLVPCPMNLVKH